jgi:hypothetical protein
MNENPTFDLRKIQLKFSVRTHSRSMKHLNVKFFSPISSISSLHIIIVVSYRIHIEIFKIKTNEHHMNVCVCGNETKKTPGL